LSCYRASVAKSQQFDSDVRYALEKTCHGFVTIAAKGGSTMGKLWLAFVSSFVISIAINASAQIVVGQTAGFTGAVAATVKEATDGARLYLDAINAKGGVNGQQIELISLDDKFDPKLAAANARTLIAEKGAVALFLTRGTPHAELIMPILDELKVPLVAPSTGAMLLHSPVKKYVFNVRSTYQREAEKGIGLLATIGITSIGVLHVDDTFGADALTGIKAGFEMAKLTPAFVGKFDRSKPDYTQFVADIRRTNPQAVFVVGSGTAVTDAMKAIRAAGSQAQMVTLSNNASAGFVKGLGANARGVIITQVFPNERSISSPLVKEALTLARAKQMNEVSPAMLEGFAAAKVLVEGLRRAGTGVTGEKLRIALETFRAFDIGGMEISYSASDHTGLGFVDLSIINKDGKFTR
jgi:branched-chain amino acid transport system substrate-binding protein